MSSWRRAIAPVRPYTINSFWTQLDQKVTEIVTATKKTQSYHVSLRRAGEIHALAEAHGHALQLGVHRGDPEAGFNAAETLMAALGACLMTNINSMADRMHLQIDDARIEIDGIRRSDPPALITLEYTLILVSPEPEEELAALHEKAVKWGTVTNTLMNGVHPGGTLRIEGSNGS